MLPIDAVILILLAGTAILATVVLRFGNGSEGQQEVDEEPPEPDEIQAEWCFLAEEHIDEGLEATVEALGQEGLTDRQIILVLREVARKRIAPLEAAGEKNLGLGIIVALIGVVLTATSYGGARSGDTYYVYWGAIAVGAIWTLRGIGQLVEYGKRSRAVERELPLPE